MSLCTVPSASGGWPPPTCAPPRWPGWNLASPASPLLHNPGLGVTAPAAVFVVLGSCHSPVHPPTLPSIHPSFHPPIHSFTPSFLHAKQEFRVCSVPDPRPGTSSGLRRPSCSHASASASTSASSSSALWPRPTPAGSSQQPVRPTEHLSSHCLCRKASWTFCKVHTPLSPRAEVPSESSPRKKYLFL